MATASGKFDAFITTWDEDGTGFFKVGQVYLRETGNAHKLELEAKHAARDIEAEVMYAWDLGKEKSDAWWLGWGGYDLEEEIPFFAAMALPDVAEKLKGFDPKDNEFECKSIDEYREMLFNAYDEDLTAKDLKAGFRGWTASLDKEAQATLLKDLESWRKNAAKG
ncbi:MAG: hypothetical protein EP348_11635 [Alphaproteobacteria bacterium]|nr:MAG: hypothetical protein EP348_11635 [Alphaproteobacteria bacterium]